MSISLSIYDLFANLLPGLLYLFAMNEILRSLGMRHMEFSNASINEGTLLTLGVGYILGHIFNNFTYEKWYMPLFRYRKQGDGNRSKRGAADDKAKALDSLKRLYPDLKTKFSPRDGDLLFNAIQIQNKELADRIESTRANAIMMRNVSFGLFLLSAAQFIQFFSNQFSLYALGLGILCLLGSWISLLQTSKYYRWFYKDVFRTAIHYGDSLHAVVDRLRKEPGAKRK